MCDKPENAGAPEVEVRPEMIEAGVAVLWDSGAVEHPTEVDRELVRKIYVAMMDARFDRNVPACHRQA